MSQKEIFNFNKSDIISSSELSQFNYCSVAWYLQKIGYEPKSPKIDIGLNKHVKVGKIIDKTKRRTRINRILASFGYLLLLLGIILLIIGVIL